jgi:hypothetical protein
MKCLVFFLEEPSAEEMLKGILPRILPADIISQFVVFRGKQDLEKRLVLRLREWRRPNTRFVVMRDQDASDCVAVKSTLATLCRQAGKPEAMIRVVCRTLESFYLGDLTAVERAFGINGLANQQRKKKFRSPDDLGNPSEELSKITNLRYQKISGSRIIAPLLSMEKNHSHSFNVLIRGIHRILEDNVWT